MSDRLKELSDVGVSICWTTSVERLVSGNLEQMLETDSVVGVTTNPSIFDKAILAAGPTMPLRSPTRRHAAQPLTRQFAP